MEAAEIEFTDYRIRLNHEEQNRNNGSGAFIAVVEMGQHFINRDVFQKSLGTFSGARQDVKYNTPVCDSLSDAGAQ